MINTFGNKFKVTIFGQSHSKELGVLIENMPNNYILDIDELQKEIDKRKPTSKWTTPRREKDVPIVEKGDKYIKIVFENNNINDDDYKKIGDTPRPSHADYVQKNLYGEVPYGGGIASGRMTLPLVAAGYIAKDILKKYYATNIDISANIESVGGKTKEEDIENLLDYCFETMDSVGAVIKCKVENPPKFVGEPFFDSVESVISHLVFSIPGIKGIAFGDGVECVKKFGYNRNDAIIDEDGHTMTNNEGGINGGITNGNDIEFRVYVKPTASIGREQNTYNFNTKKIEKLIIGGRHDICFALRVPVIVEAVTAIGLLNLC